ncbi:hypothetical protein PF006_g13029 [Phytophthora fragariae]|uniref:PAZ domain-containing protein n=1 Tax=Phytophthora fragariae TaxID=53985 RepID=A0A6A3TS20_9STRA|nr:hypothetical protein PF006_g13029 [Phytophthora fragariae]
MVNKRHHLRAFPMNSSYDTCENNVEPGTIIDTGVVDAHGLDFCLYHDHERGQQHGCQGLRITINYDFSWGGHGDFSFSGGGYDSGRSGDYGHSSSDHKRRRLGGDRDDFSGRGYRCSGGGYGTSSGGCGGTSGHDNRSGYGGASSGYEQSRSGYGGGNITGYGGSSGVYDDRSRGHGDGNEERSRGYGGRDDRGGQRVERGYGAAGSGDRGYGEGASSSGDRGYGASGVGRSDDRGYGGYGGISRRGGQSGGGAPRDQEGSGYEQIGQPIADLRIQDEEGGRAGVREVRADDADLQQEVQICRRPGVAQRGNTTQLNVNYFGISLDSVVPEIFKYHVTVERSPVVSTDAPPRSEARPERTLVCNVINAALRQYETELNGIRVVHDGMAALYSPTMLPWNAKDFADINPDSTGVPALPQQPPAGGDGAPRRGFGGTRTFVVKMKLVETISTSSLSDYYANPDVNVEPALQALDVVIRHLAAQPLRARDPNDVRDLSMRDLKSLARALRQIEVVPTHRRDRKRAICGISVHPADRTMVDIQGENMSVAAYFRLKYKMQLRYPNLPLVNVGSKRPGKEAWLPIEVCVVAAAQHCANMTDLDSAEIVRQTSYPPPIRQEKIMEQVYQAGFVNDPFLAAFGIKVDHNFERIQAHVIDAPTLLFKNVSERPTGGQWSLRGKKFVEGIPVRNWGVIVAANVSERDIHLFDVKLADSGDQCGLPFEDKNPMLIRQDQHRGAQVDELMKMCHQELERRGAGPPQFLLGILQSKNSPVYGVVKRMSDTVLGLPSQCIVSENGKNHVLLDELPLVSIAPTVIIGADVEHPRPGMGDRPSIAAVVASMDCYSAQYATRVAAQDASSYIQHLPSMLRELLLAYYENTQRKPEPTAME